MGNKTSTIAVVAAEAVLVTAPAATAEVAAVGSVLGVATQAATFLGLSTAAQSGILGMSAATLGAGAIVIVAVVAVGSLGYWLYTRRRQPQNNEQPEQDEQPIIEQVQVPNPLTQLQLQPNYQGPDIPDFQPIDMNDAQFNSILSFTQDYFNTRVQEFTCFISRQVMRQPCLMRCCSQRYERADRWTERVILQHEIQRVGRCPMCQSVANNTFIIFDNAKYEMILGFRQRLLKTYLTLPTRLKLHWRIMIDNQFGRDYTLNHLDNHPLNQL